MTKVIKSQPHFVRCIRPNVQNLPNLVDDEKVLEQLKYTGVLETIRIRKQGFPERMRFETFIERYKYILHEETNEVEATAENCVQLLRASEIDPEESWKVGRTKIFLRYWHVEKLRLYRTKYLQIVIRSQLAIRRWIFKRKMRRFINSRHEAANKIIAAWKGYRRRKDFKVLKDAIAAEVQRQRTASAMSEGEKRPFYRNLRRGELDYSVDEDAMNKMKKRKKQTFGSSDQFSRNGVVPPYRAESHDEYEGRAALEETRSIILLLQIEMTSKEMLEILDRTSYPVIHSIRNRRDGGHESGPKMKTQKLDHREKQLAMVDGYGNPLEQKYRHALLHPAEEYNQYEKEDGFISSPMLGLVNKPFRETMTQNNPKPFEPIIAPQKPVKKPTNQSSVSKAKPNSQLPKQKVSTGPPKVMSANKSTVKKVVKAPASGEKSVRKVYKPHEKAPVRTQKPVETLRKQNPASTSVRKRVSSKESDVTQPQKVDKTESVSRMKTKPTPSPEKENRQPRIEKVKDNRRESNPYESVRTTAPRKVANERASSTSRQRQQPVFGSQNRVLQETASYEEKIRRNAAKQDSFTRFSTAGSNPGSSYNIPTHYRKERQRLPTSADSIHRRFNKPAPATTNSYQPYNYLLNNQKDQSKVLHHASINGLNTKAIDLTAYGGKNGRPRTSSEEINAIKRASPTKQIHRSSSPMKRADPYGGSSNGKVEYVPRRTSTYANEKRENSNNDPPGAHHRINDYTRIDYPTHNFKTPNTGRKKVLHGFHYGLQQDNVLKNMQLNPTGRLQQLVN